MENALWDLPTHLWVEAELRRLNQAGITAMLRRRGDGNRGLVLVILNRLNGMAELYGLERDADYRLGWRCLNKADSPAIEEFWQKLQQRDEDCWVIEIELADGVLPLAGRRHAA